MTQTLLILADSPDGEAILATRHAARMDVTRGPFSRLKEQLSGSYDIVLPGQSVRAFLTDIPETVRGSDRLNVARFAHEDRVASDLNALHVVVGSGDPAPTLIVEKTLMDELLSQFDPTHIYADFDLLSSKSGQTIRLLDRVVTPGPQGDAVDPDWADMPGGVLDDESLVQALFDGMDQALDLRSGPYRRRAQVDLGAWRGVAAGLLVCIGLVLALTVAEIRAVNSQAETLSQSARQIYADATGQPAPANLARALRTSAPSDADPTAFLQLSSQLFRALSEHSDIAVERLSFDQQENSLRLRLIYPGFEAAGALEQTVTDAGAIFQTGGVREQNGRFIGDAAFRLGESS